jgi:hypothetical protein
MSSYQSSKISTLRKVLSASAVSAMALSAATAANAWDYSSNGLSIRIDSTVSVGAGIVTGEKKTPASPGDGGPQVGLVYTTAVAPVSLAQLPSPFGAAAGASGWGRVFGAASAPVNVLGAWASLAALPASAQGVGSPFAKAPAQFLATAITPYGKGANSYLAGANYGVGDFYSGSIKASHDVEIKYDNFTAFLRGYYFYDAVLNNSDSGNISHLGDQSRKYAGLNFVPLDSFIDGKFNLDGHSANLRVGKQVVNWGESTFLLNGINAFNPIDATSFHRPGTEIKEVILPQWMISGNIDVFKNLSAGGWYQLKFEPYNIDPAETWFNGSSAAGLINTGPGGMGTNNPYGQPGWGYLTIGGGAYTGNFHRNCGAGFTDLFGQPGTLAAQCASSPYVNYSTPLPTNAAIATRLALGDNSVLHRLYDQYPKGSGQFGLNLKYFAESLNSTEFGLYYADYASRLPIYSNQTSGASPSLYSTPQVAVGATTDVGSNILYQAGFAPIYTITNLTRASIISQFGPAAIKAGIPFDPTGSLGPQMAALAKVKVANPTNLINPWTGNPIQNYGDLLQARAYVLGNPNNVYLTQGNVPLLPQGIEAPQVGGMNEAFLEYPKHIKEWGASFNTTVAGVGLQGEVSYKKNDVVQLNDVEIILGMLNSACYFPSTFGVLGTPVFEGGAQLSNKNRSGQQLNCNPATLGNGQKNIAHGYLRVDDITAQFGTTQTFQPSNFLVNFLGAQQAVLVTEFGMAHYNNLPKFNELQLQQGNEVGDSSSLAGVLGLAPLFSGYATGDSGGYVLYTNLEYDNVFGSAVTLTPSIALKHDVFGITPGPASTYIKDRKTMSVSVDGSYQNRVKGSLSYTTNWGGGYANGGRGQSFVAATMSYSF